MTAPANEHLLGNACHEMTIEASRVPLSQDMDQRLLALIQEAPDKRHQEDPKGLIVDYAHVQGKGEDGALAIIASLFRREPSEDGVTLLSFRISCLNLDEQPEPPPKEKFSPLEDLLGITSQLGEVAVNCSASFVYSMAVSRIQLPSPLLLSGLGVTHIESVVLSRRTSEGEMGHTIEVQQAADGSVAHTVTIEAKGVLTWQGLSNIRAIVEDLSTTLLEQEKESA
jgi:hypothetical protein